VKIPELPIDSKDNFVNRLVNKGLLVLIWYKMLFHTEYRNKLFLNNGLTFGDVFQMEALKTAILQLIALAGIFSGVFILTEN
jgi:hypothetical protein